MLPNSRLPICGLNPLRIKGGTDHRKGSMAVPTGRTVRQSGYRTEHSPFSDLRHAQSLPATHPNTALRYCTCHIRSPGGMSWKYFVLCHTLAVTPGTTHPHAHSLTHTLTFPHRFRIPPANSTTAQVEKVWSAIPPHSHLPEGPPVPGFYLRSDPSLSWPAGKRTLASPERQARPCASCTALS